MQDNIVDIQIDEKLMYKVFVPGYKTDYIQNVIYKTKLPYEYEMLKHMVLNIEKNTAFLDIGSNIGNHSLFMMANGIQTYSVEANNNLCDILKKSVEINQYNDLFTLFNIGASDVEEYARFDIETPENLGGQSLTIVNGDERLVKGGGIKCLPIDALNISERIGMIKVDVEGMELKVLSGSIGILTRDFPNLYVESLTLNEFRAVYSFLRELGYVCLDTFNASPTHFYVHKSKIKHEYYEYILYRFVSNEYILREIQNDIANLSKPRLSFIKRLKRSIKKRVDKWL